ncbi:MAG: VanZ family protein [Candidatus Aminicenantaceae bacterium]
MKTSGKWVIVCAYTIGLFIVTPYLPNLIQAATSRWTTSGVKYFVLGVEITIALLILTIAVRTLIYKKKKVALLLISIGCIFLLYFIIYQFIPNPYEFTHLPEYAVLSMLLLWALTRDKRNSAGAEERKKLTPAIIINPYFMSGTLTGTIGTVDEIYQHFLPNRHFTWYDILLNILGGILGLLIIRGIKR